MWVGVCVCVGFRERKCLCLRVCVCGFMYFMHVCVCLCVCFQHFVFVFVCVGVGGFSCILCMCVWVCFHAFHVCVCGGGNFMKLYGCDSVCTFMTTYLCSLMHAQQDIKDRIRKSGHVAHIYVFIDACATRHKRQNPKVWSRCSYLCIHWCMRNKT